MKVKITDEQFICNTTNGNSVYQLWFSSDDMEAPMTGRTKKDASFTLENTGFLGNAEIDGYYNKYGNFIITAYKKL